MVETAIVALLLGDSDVTALVGTRVEPVQTSQTLIRPNVVYQRVTTSRVHTQDGATGLADCRLQVSCWADTYAAAKTLADKVRLALDAYKGTAAGITVDGIFLQDEGDMPQPPLAGGEKGIHGVRQDYRIHYQETI